MRHQTRKLDKVGGHEKPVKTREPDRVRRRPRNQHVPSWRKSTRRAARAPAPPRCDSPSARPQGPGTSWRWSARPSSPTRTRRRSPGPAFRREEGRGFFQDLALLREHPDLLAQPPELLTLGRAQPSAWPSSTSRWLAQRRVWGSWLRPPAGGRTGGGRLSRPIAYLVWWGDRITGKASSSRTWHFSPSAGVSWGWSGR